MRLLSSLTNRIFLASAALTLVCMGIAIYLVNVRVTAAAEDELRRGLEQTGAVVDQQLATVSDLYTVLARQVADLPKLKAAVATDDAPTVEPVAAEYQRQVDSDLLLVSDRAGRILAAPVRRAPQRGLELLPTIHEALAGRESATFWLHPAGVLQIVSVPITAGAAPPEILGTLSLGFLLDDTLALRLKGLTGSEIAIVAGGSVRAATLPGDSRAALAALAGTREVSTVVVEGNEYLALQRPLASSRSSSLFAGSPGAPRLREAASQGEAPPVAIILRSRTERLRFLRPTQAVLGVTGLIAVLLATGLSYGVARTITRPLGAITSTMKEIASTGDLTRKIAWRADRWEDEDARVLVQTFNTLTDSIARFQREAADRERLSALGRLSTVIAHEVRNPLMIIKAALRPLGRDAVSGEEIREAVSDIEEEVRRLNRLVNDVLDFARPVHFEPAPTDVNRVCEDSSAAAIADRRAARVHLALDAALPPIMTDAERLRSVLVNLLVNAFQAVDARAAQPAGSAAPRATGWDAAPAPPEDGWDVELATASTRAGGIVITVRDRGVGIQLADQERVFEPYFTTKRGGTGLGLAISRNIVEGIGGRIAMTSAPGAGTEIRIELPGEAKPRPAEGGPR
jgi:two-component system sensor histidine kinase HydH